VADTDPLSEVLQDLRLARASYGRCELQRPWGVELPPQGQARFHIVVEGPAWLWGAGLEAIQLGPGDVVLLPLGAGHALGDTAYGPTTREPELPIQRIGDRTYRLELGGAGERTLLVCCSFGFDEPLIHPLLELMPRLILLRRAAAEDPSLLRLLEAMAEEVNARRVGAATVMARLADVIVTRVVRAWVESRSSETSGWLGAIRDPDIGRALAMMHRGPGHPWSVTALAKAVGMSRSAFSERFTSAVGTAPAHYLMRWRMHLARDWLRNARLSVADVATRLGYDSEASFSRAFKRLVGVPPSSQRQVE
jgi:AraC-like DNA-binding protein